VSHAVKRREKILSEKVSAHPRAERCGRPVEPEARELGLHRLETPRAVRDEAGAQTARSQAAEYFYVRALLTV
jgi:hypothetical protein